MAVATQQNIGPSSKQVFFYMLLWAMSAIFVLLLISSLERYPEHSPFHSALNNSDLVDSRLLQQSAAPALRFHGSHHPHHKEQFR